MTGWLPRAVGPRVALSVGTSRQARTLCPSEEAISSSFCSQAAAGPCVRREEDHPDPVVPRGGELDPPSPAPGRQERVRDLRRSPAPSPVFFSLPVAPAVLEVREDLERLPDDVVRARALHVDDEAEAAGVVLEGGVVEALARGEDRTDHCDANPCCTAT